MCSGTGENLSKLRGRGSGRAPVARGILLGVRGGILIGGKGSRSTHPNLHLHNSVDTRSCLGLGTKPRAVPRAVVFAWE